MVISLASYKARVRQASVQELLYVTQSPNESPNTVQIEGANTYTVSDLNSLKSFLTRSYPLAIVIEADIRWIDLLDLIRHLSFLSKAPMILVVNRSPSETQRQLIKQAYFSGISDLLYAPFDLEELEQTVSILVKLQKTITG